MNRAIDLVRIADADSDASTSGRPFTVHIFNMSLKPKSKHANSIFLTFFSLSIFRTLLSSGRYIY